MDSIGNTAILVANPAITNKGAITLAVIAITVLISPPKCKGSGMFLTVSSKCSIFFIPWVLIIDNDTSTLKSSRVIAFVRVELLTLKILVFKRVFIWLGTLKSCPEKEQL